MRNLMKHVVFAVKAFRHCFPIALEQARQADLKNSGKHSFPELVGNGEQFYPDSPGMALNLETQSQDLGSFRDITIGGLDTGNVSDEIIQGQDQPFQSIEPNR
jgi:hypothetical protein